MHEPRRHFTLADYLAVEEMSPVKHEFFRGEIFAMAGASIAHNLITGNLLALLKAALRGTRCNVFGSDLRIATPSGLYTYPDLSVICGKVDLASKAPDTARNPVLLIEVLSDATREYDRGEKFDLYKTIHALREYLLIEQDKVCVEQFVLQRRVCSPRKISRRAETIRLASVDAELPVAEIYRGVFPRSARG
jgi:Uma2 family endonuclease